MIKQLIQTYQGVSPREYRHLERYWQEKTEQLDKFMPYLKGMVIGTWVTLILFFLGLLRIS